MSRDGKLDGQTYSQSVNIMDKVLAMQAPRMGVQTPGPTQKPVWYGMATCMVEYGRGHLYFQNLGGGFSVRQLAALGSEKETVSVSKVETFLFLHCT